MFLSVYMGRFKESRKFAKTTAEITIWRNMMTITHTHTQTQSQTQIILNENLSRSSRHTRIHINHLNMYAHTYEKEKAHTQLITGGRIKKSPTQGVQLDHSTAISFFFASLFFALFAFYWSCYDVRTLTHAHSDESSAHTHTHSRLCNRKTSRLPSGKAYVVFAVILAQNKKK